MKLSPCLLPVKAHYFLFFGGLACVMPFLSVYAKQLGVSNTVLGVIYNVLPFAVLVAKPVFGGLADRHKLHKLMFLASLAVTALAYFAIDFVPDVERHHLGGGNNASLGDGVSGETVFCVSDSDRLAVVFCADEGERIDVDGCSSSAGRYTCSISCRHSPLLAQSCNGSALLRTHCDRYVDELTGGGDGKGGTAEYRSEIPSGLAAAVFASNNDDELTSGDGVGGSDATRNNESFCLVHYFGRVEMNGGGNETSANTGAAAAAAAAVAAATANFTCDSRQRQDARKSDCAASCACSSSRYPDDGDGDRSSSYSYSSAQFVLFAALMLLSYVGAGVAISLGDALAMDLIVSESADFGLQRVWATVGWGLFAVIVGNLHKVATTADEGAAGRTNYSPGFYLLLCVLVVDVAVAFRIRVLAAHHPEPKRMLGSLLRICSDPRIAIFAAAVFVMGFMTAALWTFLAVYLLELGAPPELLGYTMGVQCFGGELPLFLLSGVILKRVGHFHTMTVCLAAYGVRYLAYSLVTDPWLILPVELLNGFTFALFYASVVPFATSVAPPGMSATVQGCLQGVFEGIGVGVGNLVSGVLYDQFGGRLLYRILGVGACVSCVVYALVITVVLRVHRSRHEQPDSTVPTSEPKSASPTVVAADMELGSPAALISPSSDKEAVS